MTRKKMHTLSLSIAWIFLLVGCTEWLDTEIKNPNTLSSEKFYADTHAYYNALAGVYGNYSLIGTQGAGTSNIEGLDAGTSVYSRGYWSMQELPTDEVKWTWENDPGLGELNRNTWGTENPIIRGFFGRCMAGVAFATDFLRQTTDETLNKRGNVSPSLKATIKTYRAEVRLLRALNYYHMMDFFGQAPFVLESDPVNASFRPPRYDRKQLFTFIEKEILEVLPDLKSPLQNEYGRADKALAWMILAKIYLNADVYIQTKKYTECIKYCDSILQGGFTLCPSYLDLFKADNHRPPAREEIIFPFISDGVTTQNWGATTLLVNAQVDAKNNNAGDFGVGGWAGGLRATATFSDVFENTPTYKSPDTRNTLRTEGHQKEIKVIANSDEGYATAKWSNKASNGTPGKSRDLVDTDFPLFRLADAYLMYAEAVLRGGSGGSRTKALDYINKLRTRAQNPHKVTDAQLTLDLLLNERLVELYWEGFRRQDLIRFGKFTDDTFTWEWKGGVQTGGTLDEHHRLFPIPAVVLASNPNLKQNAGY